MSTTTDLMAWLREQIAEIEQSSSERDNSGYCDSNEGIHFAHADVLAQCEAHRLIVDGYAALWANTDRHTDAALHLHYNVLKQVVLALALAYQHRPGYHEEWRP